MEPVVSTQADSAHWGFRQMDVWLFRWMRAGHGARAGVLPVACLVSRWSWVPLLLTLCAMASSANAGGWLILQCLCVATMAQVVSKRCAARWASPRPFALGLSQNHLGHGPRAGLPSTHAAVMGAVTGFMALAMPSHPLLDLLGGIALLTAWARIYAGAHFPSDVVLGLGLGAALGCAAAQWPGLG